MQRKYTNHRVIKRALAGRAYNPASTCDFIAGRFGYTVLERLEGGRVKLETPHGRTVEVSGELYASLCLKKVRDNWIW